MRHFCLLIGLLSLLLYQSSAQTTGCNCALTITRGGTYNNSALNIQPGQTVCIQAGHYDNLRFNGFVGAPGQPIRFVNCGGLVGVGIEANYSGILFQNSSHFVLSGSGDSNYPYGFVIDKSKNGASSVVVSGFSTDYEIERVEVAIANYAGFSIKIDPGCDSMTYQPNFIVRNVKIHDNYVHNTGGPGMFLGSGHSGTTGVLITCRGVQKRVYPVQTTGLAVYNNRVEQTGGAALHINNCPNAQVYNNTLKNNNVGPVPAGWKVGDPAGCGCDYTVTQPGSYNNNRLEVPAGKTVCIQAGHYDYLRFSGFVGTAAQPIRFINCGGQVTAGADASTSGIQFMTSRYFVLTGTGDPAHPYGIKLTRSNGGGSMGVSVGGLSSDCELDHLEVAKAGFAGIMVKTDPSCDSTTWRSNFTMHNVKIHDNYIHDVGGEGLYVGNSFYGSGMTMTCNGVQKQVYPHLIFGLEIYNNRIERSGAEGLQYACAPDAKVHHNWLQNTGISPFAAYQNNGLQISGGAGGDCYGNTVLNVAGSGIVVIGHLGNNRIYNNIVNNAGEDGIFCDDRVGSVSGTTMAFVNNTINNTGRDGIRLYNEINTNTVANNAITGYGVRVSGSRPIVLEQGATATRVSNFTTLSTSSAGYVDAPNNSFLLLPASPLIDVGAPAVQWGVITDLANLPRPVGNDYDVGAHEYSPSAPDAAGERIVTFFEVNSKADQSLAYPLPCRDQVTIQLPTGHTINRVSVYSAQGRLMKQRNLPGVHNVVTLSTQTWPTGIYTYLVRAKSRLFRGRLIKS